MKQLQSSDEARTARLMRVGNALRIMVQQIEEARDEAARRQNLHPTDFGCIAYLYRETEPVSPKQIIAELGLSSGSGTALLDRLEASGYVKRLPNPQDRRSVLIALDREAARGPIALVLRLEESYRKATDALSDHDLDTIATFLEAIGLLHCDLVDEGGDAG